MLSKTTSLAKRSNVGKTKKTRIRAYQNSRATATQMADGAVELCSPAKSQVRIIQWGVWRSLSTAFLRCMMNAHNSITFCERFGLPWYFGTEAKTSRTLLPVEVPEELNTFQKVKDEYEEKFETYDLVFSKEFAFYISHEKNFSLIPKGYRHSFLIRHPYKTCVSMRRVFLQQQDTGYSNFLEEEMRYEDCLKLWRYVKHNIDPDTIILDADDFVRNPEAVLRAYCSSYGVEYNDKMLHWDPDNLTDDLLIYGKSWFGDLLATTTVKQDENVQDLLENPPDLSGLLPEMRKSIEDNIPFYTELYNNRLKF